MNVTPIYLDRLARALATEGVKLPRTRLLSIAADAFGCRNVHELSAMDRKGDLPSRKAIDLGVTDVPHVGAMRFMRDESGYVYAVEEGRIETGRGKGWHLAPLGGLAHMDMAREACVRLPGSSGHQNPNIPYFLTDSDCQHAGDRLSDAAALGMAFGTFQNDFYPLDETEMEYISAELLVSASQTQQAWPGYSAMYRGTKHVAPLVEFQYHGDYTTTRDEALGEALAFVEAVHERIEALNGHIILNKDAGDIYGDPAHTVTILIPMSVAMATGNGELWKERLSHLIDTHPFQQEGQN